MTTDCYLSQIAPAASVYLKVQRVIVRSTLREERCFSAQLVRTAVSFCSVVDLVQPYT